MTGAGILVGLGASALLSRSIASFLFGIAPIDPITFAGVPLLLSAIAAVALWLPARRAMEIDPMGALRQD
jgi:putative ABC transport system permease protein